MNTSTIIDMINADPTIKDDVPAFIAKMNTKNIRQVVTIKTTVNDVVKIFSIAELNGGECTQRNFDDALLLMKKQPIFDEAKKRFDAVQSAISTGDVATVDDLDLKLVPANGI